jgi:hypothetical protein
MMPYTSDAQRRWAHTEAGTKALGGPAKVKEWDRASKGKDLPMKKYAEGGQVSGQKCASTRGSIPCEDITRENALGPFEIGAGDTGHFAKGLGPTPGGMEVGTDPLFPFSGESKDRSTQAADAFLKGYAKGGPVNGYAKGGDVRTQNDRARGGPVITTRSRFLKTKDVFRDDVERNDYGKSGKGGELSKTEGDTKAQKAIKPRG